MRRNLCIQRNRFDDLLQEYYPSAGRVAWRRVKQLREAGFKATATACGHAVTQWGFIRVTLVDIRPGRRRGFGHLPLIGELRNKQRRSVNRSAIHSTRTRSK